MERQYYLDLAASGLRMPIGTDLVLHEQTDPQAAQMDGGLLGQVVVETARRFRTPLALAHMDLEVEKCALLSLLDVPADEAPRFHFEESPSAAMLSRFEERLAGPLIPRLQTHVNAIRYAARQPDLVPVAMCIGPFSLMTKLLSDPITPIYLAGSGTTANAEAEIQRMETVLEMALKVVLRSLAAKIQAGAKAVCIAEPAANKVFLSPRQIEKGSDIFERYVMRCHRQIKELLNQHGVDLIFHCCGDLVDLMVRKFAELDPAILSLGSSRKLWEDAALVPQRTVLYGNLPSKRFYSDALISRDDVARQAAELVQRMREVNHPFILGSECDVLNVPGCEATIKAKVEAFLRPPGS